MGLAGRCGGRAGGTCLSVSPQSGPLCLVSRALLTLRAAACVLLPLCFTWVAVQLWLLGLHPVPSAPTRFPPKPCLPGSPTGKETQGELFPGFLVPMMQLCF